jgi:Domain of unknown function (DUF4126)
MNMDLLTTLGRTMGFSFAAGLNLYATVAILGLASRFDWVALPPQFKVFDNDIVITAAIVMYVIEFFADKIPWVDSIWDAVHTVIRPVGGALIAVATLGHANPTVQGLVALLGGSLAASTHLTKAGTRAVANASPEPFTNWILSFAEDAFVVGLGFVALKYPAVAALVVIVGVALMVVFATWIVRAVRRRWSASASRASVGPSSDLNRRVPEIGNGELR